MNTNNISSNRKFTMEDNDKKDLEHGSKQANPYNNLEFKKTNPHSQCPSTTRIFPIIRKKNINDRYELKIFNYSLTNSNLVNKNDLSPFDIQIIDSFSQLEIYQKSVQCYIRKIFALSLASILLMFLDVNLNKSYRAN